MNNAAPDGGGGSGSVSIDIDQLSAALTGMNELASRIDTQRQIASSGCPVSLPSLVDGAALARAADWMELQQPHVQTVLDLAQLLDSEGAGVVTYSGGGEFDDAERLLGEELADRLGDVEIDDVADRERYQELADLMTRYQDNRTVNTTMLRDLGPDGVTEVINRLAAMTADPPTNDYWQNVEPPANPGDESEALGDLQTSMAGALTGMLGEATGKNWFDTEEQEQWGEGLSEQVLASTILLRTADKNGTVLGGDLMRTLGHGLMEWEHGDQTMADSLTSPASLFGNESLADDNSNPILQLVRAGDNGIDPAQGLMQDEELAAYLLNGRLTDEHQGSMEDVLRLATVDAAMDRTNGRASNAAEISTFVIDYAADAPLDSGYDEELGGILGTYMTDVFKTVDGADARTIVGNVPPYSMTADQSAITEVLQQVGGNETARSVVAGSAARLNQALMDDGALRSLEGRLDGPEFAIDTTGDPLQDSIVRASGLRGYVEDAFVEGLIEDGEATAEARRHTAELFALPIDFLDTGGLGKGAPLADYLIGEIKDQVIDDYVGDPAHSAAIEGNEDYDTATRATKLQAYYSLVTTGVEDRPGDLGYDLTRVDDGTIRFDTGLRDVWPEEGGRPVAPGDLTEAQAEAILALQREEGVAAASGNTVTGYFDTQQPPHDT